MPFNLKSIFASGAEKVIKSVGDAFDRNFTNQEEREAAKLEHIKEVNRHFEAIENNILKEIELQYQDKASARTRETEFVKATGRADYFQYFIGGIAVITTCVIIFFLLARPIPEKNEHVIMLFIGELLGIVTGIYSYHFGSSLGSRIKDIRK